MSRIRKSEVVNYFVKRYCVTQQDVPVYEKAGEAFFTEYAKTAAEIDRLKKRQSVYGRLMDMCLYIGVALIALSIVTAFVPPAFLEIYGNSYVAGDAGKVEEVSGYWKAINVRDSHGHVLYTKEAGEKMVFTGHYKNFGVHRFAEIGENQWISTVSLYDHSHDLMKLMGFIIAVIAVFSCIGWFFFKKEEQYKYKIKTAKSNFAVYEANLSRATSLEAAYEVIQRTKYSA